MRFLSRLTDLTLKESTPPPRLAPVGLKVGEKIRLGINHGTRIYNNSPLGGHKILSKKCNELPSNYYLFRSCCQIYFQSPNGVCAI